MPQRKGTRERERCSLTEIWFYISVCTVAYKSFKTEPNLCLRLKAQGYRTTTRTPAHNLIVGNIESRFGQEQWICGIKQKSLLIYMCFKIVHHQSMDFDDNEKNLTIIHFIKLFLSIWGLTSFRLIDRHFAADKCLVLCVLAFIWS